MIEVAQRTASFFYPSKVYCLFMPFCTARRDRISPK